MHWQVEGHEVEWTLGYTLAEVVNAIETSSSTADTMRTMNSEKTEVGEILRKEFETIKNTFYNLKVRLYQVFSNILVRVGLKKY